jgi:fatty-acyl-CoA synthase
MDHGFGNWVTMHAERSPDAIANIDALSGEERTYRQFEERSNALANALTQRGVQQGDRIAVLVMNSIEFVEIMIANAKLGAITVPINYRLKPPEVEYILKDSGATVLLYSYMLQDLAQKSLTAETDLQHRISVPDSRSRAENVATDLEELVATADPSRVVQQVAEEDIAAIMYTSGTTGAPKGAMLSHGNMLWNAINTVMGGSSYSRYDTTIIAAPLFHIGAIGTSWLSMLFVGGRAVILESFDPGLWLSSLEKYRVTNVFLVPAMWAAVLDHPNFATTDFASLEFVISGGAPAPIPVIEAIRDVGVPFTEGFGMTETSPTCSMLDKHSVITKAGSIGKPLPFVDFRAVGEDGEDVAQGEVGELVVRGPNVFQGYWHNPEATEQALRDGWFFTGDMVTVDEDGFYTIVDRKKDMVITGGENVYSAEVEQILARHPAIQEVAVIGKPDDRWGEAVTAVAARKDGAELTEEEFIEWARQNMAHFKAPKYVEFMDELPRNATGKILKNKLRMQWQEDGVAVYR